MSKRGKRNWHQLRKRQKCRAKRGVKKWSIVRER